MLPLAPSSPPPSSILQGGDGDGDGDGTISTVHHDILQSHILSRLDGPTLATLSCASSVLHNLSSHDQLWQNICTSTWPSITHPLVSNLISAFQSGHRSFFSDSYPLLYHHRQTCNHLEISTMEFISAVDIYYHNVPIFAKVVKTETASSWFLCSPFRIDLLEPKEFVPTGILQVGEKDSWLQQLEENLTLSWILIDPKQKRAMNVSSKRPVSVQRHWLTGEVLMKFATILAGDGGKGSEKEYVECEMVVTCGGKEGGEVHLRDVSLGMEDMEGKALTGKDSLVVLKGAGESGEWRKGKDRKEGKEMYRDFLRRKKERKKRKQRRESVLDWICIAAGISSFLAFWSFILFR